MKPSASALSLALGLAVAAGAQERPQEQPPAVQGQETTAEKPRERTEAPPPSGARMPTRDLFDVLRDLRHKPLAPPPGPEAYKRMMVAAAPVVSYNPTSGFGIGAAGNAAFYKGPPAHTRISTLVASVIATTKDQVLVNAKLNASARENRWHLEGDNRLYWTSQETYGLGSGTLDDASIDQKYDYFRFYDTLYWKVGPEIYLGAGLLYNLHTDVRPADDEATAAWPDSPYVTYSEQHGLDLARQASAGFSVQALLDNRDSPINPSRGWYGKATWMLFYRGFLGGTSDWRQISYDARTYLRLSKDARHRLAFWLSGDFATGVVPYLDLPATGTDTYGRAGRGYPQGRFRGHSLVYGELEYRWTISRNGLLGLVAFLNTETLSSQQTGEKVFDSFATGAGIGLRVMLNKASQTNLCFDIGRGQQGSKAVYFAVQEAF